MLQLLNLCGIQMHRGKRGAAAAPCSNGLATLHLLCAAWGRLESARLLGIKRAIWLSPPCSLPIALAPRIGACSLWAWPSSTVVATGLQWVLLYSRPKLVTLMLCQNLGVESDDGQNPGQHALPQLQAAANTCQRHKIGGHTCKRIQKALGNRACDMKIGCAGGRYREGVGERANAEQNMVEPKAAEVDWGKNGWWKRISATGIAVARKVEASRNCWKREFMARPPRPNYLVGCDSSA